MTDRVLEKLIKAEIRRQQETINLIPSENYVSPDVLAVLGSSLTNKYSEGYPGRRYYPGNEFYDQIELLAQSRLKKLFKLRNSPAGEWSVNVQPYSGTPAMLAVYFALMEPGEKLLGMSLLAGGHLSHGHRVNLSGRIFQAIQYGVDADTGLIDYDEVERLALQHKPRVIVSGATAYSRVIDFTRFGAIAKKVGAFHVADISHLAGLVAAGLHPSPFPHSDVVVTTTHKTLRGPRAAVIFSRSELADRIDRIIFPGMQGGPHNNVIAAIAVMAQEGLRPEFKNYQRKIVKNAEALSHALVEREFVLLTGGTDNHLILIDLKPLGWEGLKAQQRLEAAGITANRNALAGDSSPYYPSGLRLGTPAVTTRGMKEPEMEKIADWLRRLLIKKEAPGRLRQEVRALCRQFPLPY